MRGSAPADGLPPEHAEARARLSAEVAAVVVLGDQFEIDRPHGAVRILDFQPHIRKDEVAVVQRKVLVTRVLPPGSQESVREG